MSNINPTIVTNGLICCLDPYSAKSYSGSGSTLTDVSRSGNNFTINGQTYSNGAFSYSSNYISSNTAFLPTTAYTKIAFAYLNSYASNNIVGGGTSIGQHTLWFGSSNTWRAGHNGAFGWAAVQATTTTPLSTWTMGAVTFNTTTGWVLYNNGVQESTNSATSIFTGAATGSILLGSYNYGSFLNGKIGAVLIYNRVLTAAEITQTWKALKGRYGL